MRGLARLVIGGIKGFRWIIDILVVVAVLCLLTLFFLQLPHPEGIDRFWPVIQLQEHGDPVLAEAGSLMFAHEEGEPPPWPSEELRFFPLLLVVGIVVIRMIVHSATRPVLRACRNYLQSTRPEDRELPRRPRPARKEHKAASETDDEAAEKAEPPKAEPKPEREPEPPQTTEGDRSPAEEEPEHASGDETVLYQTTALPRSGQKIGRYVIDKELGRGAMGVVYKATDPKIGRPVAIKKILTASLAPSELEQYLERFHQEARAAGQLSHRGIVAVYDIVEEDGESSLVMEYVEGVTLDDLVERERLPLGRSLDIMLQVAEALGYAHEREVVHRDMKPGNILVTPDEVAKITDFGIAKLVGSKLTRTGQIMGTPAYMSPEQFRDGAVDSRSDVFSLGSILYWLCTGEAAFPGESLTTIAFKVVQTSPIPPRELNPALPKEIDLLISKAMAKAPEERYASGSELAVDLEAFRDGRRLSVETDDEED